MVAEQQITKPGEEKNNLKRGAKITLTLIMLNVVLQLATIYQTRYQLVSPLIPESTIWEINKQFIFEAVVSAVVSLIALILYFFDKYVLVIVLVILTLTISRFIYV